MLCVSSPCVIGKVIHTLSGPRYLSYSDHSGKKEAAGLLLGGYG